MKSKEKVRLINAHEVLLTDKERKACKFDAGMAYSYQEEKILTAPTIEAIPIEWVKKYRNQFETTDDYYMVINYMLQLWEKENGTETD